MVTQVIIVAFLMGKPRKTWREVIKKRIAGLPTGSTGEAAASAATSTISFSTSQSSIVDTLVRPTAQPPAADAALSTPVPASEAAPRSNTALSSETSSSSTYVDTLSRADGKKGLAPRAIR